MKDKQKPFDNAQGKEPGWEFPIPEIFLNTFFWVAIFSLIGLFFSYVNFAELSQNTMLIIFFGGVFAVLVLIFLLLGKKIKTVYRPKEELEKMGSIAFLPEMESFNLPKIDLVPALFVIIIASFLINQFLMIRANILGNPFSGLINTINSKVNSFSNMKLTAFDVALAKERMDKNNDGICDECGMKIEQCIETGQIDCTMGRDKNGMGALGSQHIHADFKVYVNGQALDFAKPEYFMKSSVLHVDSNQNREDSSGVLHMHATNVPLWLFFKSLGFNLQKDSLTLSDGRIYKSENGNSLKFYLNGQKADDLSNYIFQPLDKILISFGPENNPDIERQINSVTNFAKDH